MAELPVWRSLLFVPANVVKYVGRAAGTGADAFILDLEDSVPVDRKDEARAALPGAVQRLAPVADVLVRINRPLGLAVRDIEAAVGPQVAALMLPKVESASHIRLLAEVVLEAELRQGLAPGHTRLYPLVESLEAFEHLGEIARAHPRLVALTLGAQDFSAALGAQPDPDVLRQPRQQVILAARAAGLLPLGAMRTTADFQDVEGLRAGALEARRYGMEGSPCIHPAQVAVLNAAFTPSEDEVAQARRVIAADEAAQSAGRGSVALDGRMVDVPVVLRARRTLAVAARIAAKT